MWRPPWKSSTLAVWLFISVAAARADQPPLILTDPPHQPATPGYLLIRATATIEGKSVPICTGIFLPKTYFDSQKRLPMIVTLHNRGLSGSGGGDNLISEGLASLVASGTQDTRGTGEKPPHPLDLRAQSPVIVLIPQCPPNYGWESPPIAKMLDQLIGTLAQTFRIDEDRCYLTGFSYGGSSTWQVALQIPQRFAALVTIDGRATADPTGDAKKLAGIAIYQVVGDADSDFIPEAQRMHAALLASKHPNYVFRTIRGGNHWDYGSVYTDPDFWTWLLKQHRSSDAN